MGPSKIDHSIGVMKAYTTRVGNGPFPTELQDDELLLFEHNQAREIGTTTGRKRRLGWFDVPMARQAVCLNGLNSVALTKLDVLDNLKEIKVCLGYELNGKKITYFPTVDRDFASIKPIYETFQGWNSSTRNAKSLDDLPIHAISYVKALEKLIGVNIGILSVGPARKDTLILDSYFK